MAKNLVATPWRWRAADPGFGYAGGFQDILTAYNGLNHRGADKRYHDNQLLLENQIYHLEELKGLLETDEDNFFKMFGIYHQDKKECFRKLKEKIEEWDKTGAGNLINDASVGNKFYEGLRALQEEAIFAEITPDYWDLLLSEAFSEDNETVQKYLEDGLDIIDLLNTIAQEVDGKKSNKPAFSRSSKSSLIGNLSVSLVDGKIQITSNQGHISKNLQKKIVTKLEKFLDKKDSNKPIPVYNFKRMINDLFDTLAIDPKAKKYIKQALGKKDLSDVQNRYAFHSSSPQIKGFMGELYNNAFLYFMADGEEARKEAIENITPTGNIKNQKGASLVIDTWLDGYGIQVKNYEKHKVEKQGFIFNKSYDAHTFITQVLQLGSVGTSTTASVGDILLNFFTAFDYNQDYMEQDPDTPQTDAYKFWSAARSRMKDKMGDNKTFTNIIMPYIDKVIGIDQKFSSGDQMFVKEKEYRNTFFNISGNYIPSSVLVQAIIDTINKKKSSLFSEMVAAEFRIVSYSQSKEDKWSPDITNKQVANVFSNREKYAATTKIDYTIKLDVGQISQYILGKL